MSINIETINKGIVKIIKNLMDYPHLFYDCLLFRYDIVKLLRIELDANLNPYYRLITRGHRKDDGCNEDSTCIKFVR